jgi:putative transposase
MKVNTSPLKPETYYHIYNRGINGEIVFKEERNYKYFLQLYAKYIDPIADTYAYCLLKNHFHFHIRTRTSEETKSRLFDNRIYDKLKSDSFYISNQFAKFFNSYAQSVNKAVQRTGGLFEESFRRIEIKDEHYFTGLIWYIHFNPQKHGFVKDFKDYRHSSYQSHLGAKATKLNREEVLNWFGGKNGYLDFHQAQYDEDAINGILLE